MTKIQPIGKSSENTKNSMLTTLLSKLGLEAYFERTINIINVEKPDIQIVEDGYYFIEAKQKPSTIQDATAKAYKYRQSLISKGIIPKAVFGVLYSQEPDEPCEITVLFNYEPYFARKSLKNIEELANWIYDFIKNPPKPTELETEAAIKTLREIVNNLSDQMRDIFAKDIENIFGGESVFENILEYKDNPLPINEMRKAAAFLLVNQLLFYRILSKENKKYLDIDDEEIKSPKDLSNYFSKELKKDYAVIFGFDIISKIPVEALSHLKAAIVTIKALTTGNIPHDLVGRIFHDLIPFNLRKLVAAFYTNNEAAELLAALAINSKDDKIADFACGSGTLLVAAYQVKKQLYMVANGNFTAQDHTRFLENDITGIDIMPFAAHLAAVNLSLQAPLYYTQRIRIAIWDSTDLTPNKSIPALHTELAEAYKTTNLDVYLNEGAIKKKYLKKGGIALDKDGRAEIPLSLVDVVIMNPPFTRQERLPEKYKENLLKKFKEYYNYITASLGLHGYFILLSDRFLKEGGRMAFVLPATVFRLKSFEGIKNLLSEKYWLKYIVINQSRSAFSESTQVREVLLIAEKSRHKGPTIVATVKEMPKNREEAIRFAESIKNAENNEYISTINESQENVLENINRYLGSDQLKGEEILTNIINNTDKLKPLNKFLNEHKAKILRGIQIWKGDKIYAAKMFILFSKERALKEQDEWYIKEIHSEYIKAKNRINGLEVEILKDNITPALRRFSGIGKMDISNELDFLIINKFGHLDYFIDNFEEVDLNRWKKDLTNKKTNAVIVGRFDLSATGTKSLSYYSSLEFTPSQMFWLIKNLPSSDAKIFVLFWNSSVNILQILLHKKETRGAYIQLLKYSFENFFVLDPSLLSLKYREGLIKCFDEISKEDMPSVLYRYENSNSLQQKIDLCIFRALDIDLEEDQLKNLYMYIAGEIKKLKGVMK